MATRSTPTPVPGSRAEKRRSLVRGARTLFGRDGYARTTVEAVAATSGVSTRTIYNHYPGGKEQLFAEVLLESATGVADAFEAHLAEIVAADVDTDEDLRSVARALVRQQIDHPEHFAMVRQINVEAAHVPEEVLRRWQDAGPRRVEGAIARHLVTLTSEGRLRAISEPHRAARHFIALVASEITIRSGLGAVEPSPADIEEVVSDGVEVFLHGYAPER